MGAYIAISLIIAGIGLISGGTYLLLKATKNKIVPIEVQDKYKDL
jgi:hypothetical protein